MRQGTHWRELYHSDRDLYDLCFWRTAEIYPALDNPEASPAAVDVIFSSRGATLTLGLIDQEAVNLFAYGHCAFLALKMHDLSGLPLMLFTNPKGTDGWSGHAAVKLAEDAYLDIEGEVSLELINQRYSMEAIPQEVSREDFVAAVYRRGEDPYSELGALELRFLAHFAELVLAQAAVPLLSQKPSKLKRFLTGV